MDQRITGLTDDELRREIEHLLAIEREHLIGWRIDSALEVRMELTVLLTEQRRREPTDERKGH